MTDPEGQAAALTATAEEALPEGRLAQQLGEKRELRVKLGIDPTAPDIHLGHVVVLQKLREFQDAGHRAVLIIGDYTARIGDPSGQSAERRELSTEQIHDNAQTFKEQAFKVIDPGRTETCFNSQWLDDLVSDAKLFDLLRRFTVARLLERDDFQRRIEADRPISALELLYPIFQGYDSVAVQADVELGGTDQKFNLLFARAVQQALGHDPQSVVTMPILVGTDGAWRMSKSMGNYVGVTDVPEEMFGKLMSIPDDAMAEYYRLLLGEEAPGGHPAEAKRTLARRLVERFHDAGAAEAAESHFDRLHVDREAPDEVDEAEFAPSDPVHLPALIAETFELSRSEARRLIKQGGVRLDGEVLPSDDLDLEPARLDGALLQVGRRRFRRLRAAERA
jgi:tyrosyl-tRNA synthetase